MSNITITNIDLGSVELRDGEFEDGLLTFGGAGTVVEGTILARNVAGDKLVPYVKDAVDATGIPVAVMQYEVEAAGAGDVSVKPLIKGVVKTERLIISSGGDQIVDAGVQDALRDFSIVCLSTEQLANIDNPQV
jgi:hypothetical protein